MAIEHRGWASGNPNLNTTTPLVIPNTAGSPQPGDYRLLLMNQGDATVSVTPPAGWDTLIDVGAGELYLFGRVFQSGDGSASFSVSEATTHAYVLGCFSGVDNATPIDVTAAGNASSWAAPSITTATVAAWLICAWGALATSTASTTFPAGMTGHQSPNASFSQKAAMAYEPRPTAGATGTRTAGGTSITAARSASIALRPAPTAVAASTSDFFPFFT